MILKKTSLLCIALVVTLIMPLTAWGEKNSQEQSQRINQPEMASPVTQGEDVSHVNGDLTLTIPTETADLVLVDTPQNDPNGVLFSVSEKDSVDAALADGRQRRGLQAERLRLRGGRQGHRTGAEHPLRPDLRGLPGMRRRPRQSGHQPVRVQGDQGRNAYEGTVSLTVDGVAYTKGVTLAQGTIKVDVNAAWIHETASAFGYFGFYAPPLAALVLP